MVQEDTEVRTSYLVVVVLSTSSGTTLLRATDMQCAACLQHFLKGEHQVRVWLQWQRQSVALAATFRFIG